MLECCRNTGNLGILEPMRALNRHQTSLWFESSSPDQVQIIDQRFLPHEFKTTALRSVEESCEAIRDMKVRGAPLIGVTAAFGMYLAALKASENSRELNSFVQTSAENLIAARPTAVNLAWAVNRQLSAMKEFRSRTEKAQAALRGALALREEDIQICRAIGAHGLELIRGIYEKKRSVVNVLTHCNAGWLACIDWGTATAPIYQAFDSGIPIHVWVDETRPRNQGASLTAWELEQHGVPFTLITDNAGGHLMQHGKVDMVIVGTDRTTRTGDVANKIGTYLKALAAYDNAVPFYAAVPSSSIDWNLRDGILEIPIEERSADEVRKVSGLDDAGILRNVLITTPSAHVSNFGFDVTPSKLVSGLITERGVCRADEESLIQLFPEQRNPGA